MTNQKDIFSYLVPGKCAHLAGIGGVYQVFGEDYAALQDVE